MHLNARGKEWLAGQILRALSSETTSILENTTSTPTDYQPPPPGTNAGHGQA